MTPEAAKKGVVLLMLTTGVVAVVQAARAGRKPRFSIGVGVLGSAIVLAALAEAAPAMAVGLAGLTTFGAAAASPQALVALGDSLSVRRVSTSQRVPGESAWEKITTNADGTNPVATVSFSSRQGSVTANNPTTRPPNLVSINQGSHSATPAAAAALAAAEAKVGHKILVTDSYRSFSVQAAGHAKDPHRFAPAETSAHVRGEAFDIVQMNDAATVAAMKAAGFCQARPNDEPWHFSINGCH